MKDRIFADLFGKRIARVLFGSCAVCAVVVLVAQIGLRNPVARTFFTRMEVYEGAVQPASEIGAGGTAVLVMESGTPGAAVEILLNGEYAEAFDAPRKEVRITVPTVVEVRSRSNEPVRVRIDTVSDELYLTGDAPAAEVADGYGVLGRIGVK